MKTFLILCALELLISSVYGQDSTYKTCPKDIDSVITIEEQPFTTYMNQALIFPSNAGANGIVGEYVGCIRLNKHGKLISVSTINSLGYIIDNHFQNTIESVWKGLDIKVRDLEDTTDFIIPVKFMLSKGPNYPPVKYRVSNERAPKFLAKKIELHGYKPKGKYCIKNDKILAKELQQYSDSQKYKKCVETLNEMIRRNPYNAKLIYMRANIFLEQEEKQLAMKDYYYLKNFLGDEIYKNLNIN